MAGKSRMCNRLRLVVLCRSKSFWQWLHRVLLPGNNQKRGPLRMQCALSWVFL